MMDEIHTSEEARARASNGENLQGEIEAEELKIIAAQVPGGLRNVQATRPLSALQDGMLFHRLLDEQHDTYVLTRLLELDDISRLDAWAAALGKTIASNEALRIAIVWKKLRRPIQVVCRHVSLPIEHVTLNPDVDVQAQLSAMMSPQHQRMDVQKAPLVRLRVAKDPHSARCYAVLVVHHVICDHDSLNMLVAEALAMMAGRIPPVRTGECQGSSPQAPSLEAATAFFRRKLGDIAEPTAPFGLLDIRGGQRIEESRLTLDLEFASWVRTRASAIEATPARLFHAAWALVVAATSARDEALFGSVLLTDRRRNAQPDRPLGLAVNTLPVRLRLHGLTARGLIDEAHRELSELRHFDSVPLPVARRAAGIAGTAPLFTALLNYRRTRSSSDASSAGVRVLARGESWTNYPLTLIVEETASGFELIAQTDSRVSADRILGYLKTTMQSLLRALVEAPDTPVLALRVVPEDERLRLITQFRRPYDLRFDSRSIHELFEQQVRRTPDGVALDYEGRTLSYSELNVRANQLARYLRARGVGPDELVGIGVERTLDTVVALLAILKAGGAYVPLDPNYPRERLRYMLNDCAPRVLLLPKSLRSVLEYPAERLIDLDCVWEAISGEEAENLQPSETGIRSNHLAYVIYTSGSTGEPKGVMVEHRNVVRLFSETERFFHFDERDVWTVFHSFAFDFSVWELWGALLYGGRALLVPYVTSRSPDDFHRLVCERSVTVLNQTPSAFSQFIAAEARSGAAAESLRVVVFGGEALELHTLRPWVERRGDHTPQLINMYGITETTVHVSYRPPLTAEQVRTERGSGIGSPLPDLRVYVIDARGELAPIGVCGEICVAGAGVARGYLNRPQLTAERFVQDTFSADPSARMYRSGDLGRWTAEGTLEYLGRNDHQVKIRGFRIELGEIEAQLARCGGIREVVVIARQDADSSEKQLVAYLTSNDAQPPAAEVLRANLREILPDYMVPSAFVVLDRLPLTENGKLDRRALPAPDRAAHATRAYEPPRGEAEELLARVWCDLLRIERVGRHDHFFELGGHSLLIVQMRERLDEAGCEVSVRDLLDCPVLSQLATTLKVSAGQAAPLPPSGIPEGCESLTPDMVPLAPMQPEHIEHIARHVPGGATNIQDVYPLTPLQEGILFHHLLSSDRGDTYVVPTLLSVESRDRLEQLIAGLQAAIDRHDALRTAVLWEQLPQPVQVVYRHATLPVEEVASNDIHEPLAPLAKWMAPGRQRLDLRCAPLMRLLIAPVTGSARWHALLQLHHIICDITSLEGVIDEVIGHFRGEIHHLPEPVPYRNHVVHALSYARSDAAEAFFRNRLADVDEPTIPFGLTNVRDDADLTAESREDLAPDLALRTRSLARHAQVSVATLFHAAWALVLARTSGRDDVVFGTVLLGRMQSVTNTRRIVGMFINTLPLRLRLCNRTAGEFVKAVQRELLELFEHEQASLALAQRCSGVGSSIPLFNALLNYRHSRAGGAGWSNAAGIEVLGSLERTNYPISLSIDDRGAGFSITAQTIGTLAPERIAGYFLTALSSLLDALERNPQTPARALKVLPDQELALVLREFNTTFAAYPRQKLLHHLLEEQVALRPDALAVRCGEDSLTYQQLNARANRLAHTLVRRGVGPERFVGLFVERGVNMVVSMLAILKSGGAYVPLDPSYPRQRLEFILEDTAPAVVITQERLRDKLPDVPADIISLDRDETLFAIEPATNLSSESLRLSSSNLAYAIYTSGSTGKPKGVIIAHQQAVNLVCWALREFDRGALERTLHATSLNFDLSVYECFVPLAAGCVVHVVANALALARERTDVTLINTVPSAIAAVLDAGALPASTRVVNLAGEALRRELVEHIFAKSAVQRVCNLYGPSETTTYSTFVPMDRSSGFNGSIGRPIANTRIYILDPHQQPLPLGAIGEIYIGGEGIARGYLKRPDLTAERFLADPFDSGTGRRMYRTGDLGRWLTDGTIEYLGRDDHQVKIRGFRIELGEIESELLRHEQISDAVVIAREDQTSQKRLVAYVVPAAGCAPSVEAIRARLGDALPEHMVPGACVILERLPRTSNGKLDRRALPEPGADAYVTREFEAAEGEIEQLLAQIWQELLGVARVGRKDNFFDLGGHSLLATRAVTRLNDELDLDFGVGELFERPTIHALGNRIMQSIAAEMTMEAT